MSDTIYRADFPLEETIRMADNSRPYRFWRHVVQWHIAALVVSFFSIGIFNKHGMEMFCLLALLTFMALGFLLPFMIGFWEDEKGKNRDIRRGTRPPPPGYHPVR